MARQRALAGLALAAAVLLLSGCFQVERSSVSSTGGEGNGPSQRPSLSDDGRYVAFESTADNLVAGDTDGVSDIFVRDHVDGTTQLVSVGAGAPPDGASTNPSISDDGRYVAFTSTATNLVAGDTNGLPDAFVRDRQAGTTERISLNDATGPFGTLPARNTGARISGDGRFVVYVESVQPFPVFSVVSIVSVTRSTAERQTLATTQLFPPVVSGPTGSLAVSDDGSRVVYGIVTTNGGAVYSSGIVLWDRATGQTTAVGSTGPTTVSLGALSGDGRVVTLSSTADLVPEGDTCGEPPIGADLPPECDPDAFVWYPDQDRVESVTADDTGDRAADPRAVALDEDGTTALFASNPASGPVLWARDLTTGATSTVADGVGTGAITDDGRLVAFASPQAFGPADTNGVLDVYVRRALEPTVSSVEPASLPVGPSTITVHGSGLDSDTTLRAAAGGITFTSIEVVDAETLRADVVVDASAPPVQNLLVDAPGRVAGTSIGAASSVCSGCLRVG